jgi:hypothetical protein
VIDGKNRSCSEARGTASSYAGSRTCGWEEAKPSPSEDSSQPPTSESLSGSGTYSTRRLRRRAMKWLDSLRVADSDDLRLTRAEQGSRCDALRRATGCGGSCVRSHLGAEFRVRGPPSTESRDDPP